MKKILLAAATRGEIDIFIAYLHKHYQMVKEDVFQNKNYQIHILLTGVGMMQSAFALASAFSSQPFDAAMQAGIAGAFDSQLAIGTVVAVQSECYGDLGAEDKEDFIDIVDLGFLQPDAFPFQAGRIDNEQPLFIGAALPMYPSLSVNTVSGQQSTIDARNTQYHCALETMEGIAFHYACRLAKIPFLQVRAISNYVTPRNRNEWNIPLAIGNVNQYLIETFK
jgi:futalosine hydrolase